MSENDLEYIDEELAYIEDCENKECDYYGQGGCMLPGACIFSDHFEKDKDGI